MFWAGRSAGRSSRSQREGPGFKLNMHLHIFEIPGQSTKSQFKWLYFFQPKFFNFRFIYQISPNDNFFYFT